MRAILLSAALIPAFASTAQLNIDFVGQLDYQVLRNSNLSNLWGYTDEFGNEYALMGVCGTDDQNPGGLSVVSLADPTDPQEIFFFPGPASIWREIKVWGDYAYVTTEAADGELTIVDLSPLPQSTNLPAIVWDAPGWTTSHSLFIDENGRLFIHGANRGNGGVIMYDLTQDPMNPVEVGEFDTWYCHDSFARGDTLYAGHIYDGFFSIVDVSDPSAPVLLGTKNTPSDFTHNTWLDSSGDYLFTTDERTNAYVGAYDVSDPTDITEVDRLRSDNGSGAIPHNTYWLNGYAVTSYYTFGVTIYDVSDPHNMVEVGHYDTTPLSGDGFSGAWGVYPYFPSGNLIISDMQRGLFVLAPTYVQACWLEGPVTNAVTSAPVGNATVQISGTSATDNTDVSGQYATGFATAGSYTVIASAPGYYPATINGVQLVNGQVTVLPIELEPMVPFDVTCSVVTQGTGVPVEGATVVIESQSYSYTGTTDASGNCTLQGVFAESYSITAGRWGWHTSCIAPAPMSPSSNSFQVQLPAGYADDFALDLGWTVSGDATSGQWERGVPEGTSLGNDPSNPSSDAAADCGESAFVTGLSGGGAGDNDVDGGSAVVTSPLFDATGDGAAHVRYERWFVNGGGSGNPNDQLLISLDNGSTTMTLETITANGASNGTWLSRDYRISDFLEPTATMRLIASTADSSPGHVVEAGFDVFELYYVDDTGIEDATARVLLFPNPSDGMVRVQAMGIGAGTYDVIDHAGRVVVLGNWPSSGVLDADWDLAPGAYTLNITGQHNGSARIKLIITR
ncbi:MAG: choice-of-anchor B family protein [Flavobacteriales bacterium]|nr:choice-of-anchor B family protein [Flavobacteriales bacterium]